jgi:hypothetical protein
VRDAPSLGHAVGQVEEQVEHARAATGLLQQQGPLRTHAGKGIKGFEETREADSLAHAGLYAIRDES